MKKNIQSNIWKLYVLTALNCFMLINPIIVLFLKENWLSMMDILILESIYSIAIILFEIPSWYFSDKMWRKFSLIIWSIFSFLGVLIYSFWYWFNLFLIWELVLWLGVSFISWSNSALLYETLDQQGKKEDYKKMEWKMIWTANFSFAISSFIWWFIALISLRLPLYIEIFTLFSAIPIAFTLIEPNKSYNHNKKWSLKEIINIIKYSIHEHKEIKWLIFYTSFIWASIAVSSWLFQPYFELVNLPLAMFWVIFWIA